MRLKIGLLLFLFIGIKLSLRAESFSKMEGDPAFFISSENATFVEENCQKENSISTDRLSHFQNTKLALKYKRAFSENRRFTAAMLTFALGMLGVHRLYLGTKPWIPAVYLLTFGGGFLILPLIDLGVILFCKDISQYENNDKVLMWVK